MKRLTSDDRDHILASLNIFFADKNEVWMRGCGPEPDYKDTTLVEWILRAAKANGAELSGEDAESLGVEMYDCLFDGTDTVQGILAMLHSAAVCAAELRGRLMTLEDALGEEYDVKRLRELAEADKAGRVVVLPCKVYQTDGVRIYETAVKRVIYDTEDGFAFDDTAISKIVFLTREEAEAALKARGEG